MMDNNNKTKISLNYTKEWNCPSPIIPQIILTLCCLCSIFLINWLWNIKLNDPILYVAIAISILFIFFPTILVLYKLKKYNFVQFTPDYIFINNKKINITQLSQIEFVRYCRSYYKRTSYEHGIIFVMKFKPDSEIKKDIQFIMKFPNLSTYNYKDRFLKVILNWVVAKNQK